MRYLADVTPVSVRSTMIGEFTMTGIAFVRVSYLFVIQALDPPWFISTYARQRKSTEDTFFPCFLSFTYGVQYGLGVTTTTRIT